MIFSFHCSNNNTKNFHIVAGCLAFIPISLKALNLSTHQVITIPGIERRYSLIYFLIFLFSSSVIVTGIGTFLIIFRILSATRNNPSISSPSLYRKIQRIVVESGILYSTGMLITGISFGVSTKIDHDTKVNIGAMFASATVLAYSQAVLTPLAVSLFFVLIRTRQKFTPTSVLLLH